MKEDCPRKRLLMYKSLLFLYQGLQMVAGQGLILRSLVSLAVMEEAVVLRSRASRIVWLYFWMLHPALTLDGFEDVLDR